MCRCSEEQGTDDNIQVLPAQNQPGIQHDHDDETQDHFPKTMNKTSWDAMQRLLNGLLQ